ncbi:MAG: M15 family metallopeptidase [Actinomycetota bacterium]|nr:M15 family metallopeptidase [Actinomycetota bacterium]
MSRHRFGVLAPLIAAAVLATAVAGDAAAPLLSADDAATASAVAVAQALDVDAVSIYQTGELTTPIRDAALAAAATAGAPAVVTRGFSIGLIRVRRGATIVQQSTGQGWAFPMSVSAVPLEAIASVMGRSVSGPISQAQIVMSQTSASLRGAQQGDIVDLLATNGGTVSFMIGRIATDEEVGGTEIVMSPQMADMLGANITTRVLIYGQMSRTAVNNALAARGLLTNSKVRVRRSWDPADPDNTLGMGRTKSLLGEFDIDYAHLSTNGWTAMGAAWKAAHLPSARETYPTGIRAMCNYAIKADLIAALQEVVSSNLGGYIDVTNTNSYGGCSIGMARFARITQNLGSVSRHSWGQPIDMNTVTNCQGCVPEMDCRIVRIFRKHNFAWGGNFLTADGMHFEWVGERRDQLQYPSKYCANLAIAQVESMNLPPPPTNRATLFADDGWMGE